MRPGLETVDITDGFSAEGWLQRHFGNHHSIRRASALLFDLSHVVAGGVDPECRAILGTGTRDGDGVWRLGPAVPPSPDASRSCPPFIHQGAP